jgi:hypothetical protein
MATGLKSNLDIATRPREGMKPLEKQAKYHLDATTNLEGGPKEGEKVSPPLDLLCLSLNVVMNADHTFLVPHSHRPIPGATPARAWREATRPPPETRRTWGKEQLGKGATVDGRQTGDGGGEVE